jgi:hypothetical protein
MPYNSTTRNAACTGISGQITYVGVHTLVDPGTGTTANAGEASGGSYIRQAVAWASASAGTQANSGALTIPVPAGTYGFLTFWNAQTLNSGTQYMGYAPMGGASAIKGFATVDPTLSNNQYFAPGHGLSNGNTLFVYPEFGTTLTAPLATGTLYYVITAATNTFQLSTTSGGSAVPLTTLNSGVFYWQRIVSEVFNAAGNITVAIGALVIDTTAM